jgi:hypothetical protein
LSLRSTCNLITAIIVVILFNFFNFFLNGLNRGWISNAFSVDFHEVLLGLILPFDKGLFGLSEGQLPSKELPPVLIELLDPIKSEGDVIFVLNALIFGPQRNKFDIDLKLFEESWLEFFSNFEFVSDDGSNTFFVIDFKFAHFDRNFVLDEFVSENARIRSAESRLKSWPSRLPT